MEDELSCKNHPVPAVFYCKSPDCMFGICRDCGFYHLGHEKNLSINDNKLPEYIKADIFVHITTAEKLLQENAKVESSLVTMLNGIKQETLDLGQNIKKYFNELIESVMLRQKQLISYAETESRKIQDIVIQKINDCQEISCAQKSLIESLKKFYAELNGISNKEIISKTYHVFHSFPLIKPLVSSEKYKFFPKFCSDDTLGEDIMLTGKVFTYKDKPLVMNKPSLYFFKEFCKNIFKYDLESKQWSKLTQPTIPSFHNVSPVYVAEKNIYVLVGNAGVRDLLVKFYPAYSTIEEEDLSFEYPQWSCCVYYWESIYLIGGEINDSSSSVCRRYCPKTLTWYPVGSMVIPRDSASAVGFADFLYVFGGYTNNCSLNSIETYSQATDHWSLVRIQMPMPLAFSACISLGNHILIFGGEFNERNSDQVFSWDSLSKLQRSSPLSEPFTAGSSDIVLLVHDKIFIIRADQEEFPRIEIVNY